MYYDCMEDCIHLHACRLLAKRYRDAGSKFVPRYCNEDCPAYQRMREVYVVGVEDACYTARRQYDGPQDPYDAYCSWDFDAFTAYEIENGDCCSDVYEDDSNVYAVSKRRANKQTKQRSNSLSAKDKKKSSKKSATAQQSDSEKRSKSSTPYKCADESYLALSEACAKAFGSKK